MAGESYLTYGRGYSFDGAALLDSDGYFDDISDRPYFDREKLRLIEPFHGSPSARFAVLARSTVRSGDTQEWGYELGLQPTALEITPEEHEAFVVLITGIREELPELWATASESQLIISLTADI